MDRTTAIVIVAVTSILAVTAMVISGKANFQDVSAGIVVIGIFAALFVPWYLIFEK